MKQSTLLSIVTLLVTLALPAFAGPTEKAPPPSPFMMCTHHLDSPNDRSDAIRASLKDGALTGYRDEVPWSHTEKTTGTCEFSPLRDYSIQRSHEIGLHPLLIFDYSNPNYDGGLPPRSDAGRKAFARYATELVKRYGYAVRDWEVWNEPNGKDFWPPQADAKSYTELLKTTYNAVKEVDPTATIGGIVTAGIDFDYIEAVLKAGGAKYMDVVSVHPYRYPRAPEVRPTLVDDLERLRDLLRQYGAPDRIWLTEAGYPTHRGENGVSLERQAEMISRTYLLALSVKGVERLYWYDLLNDGPKPDYNEHNFGVLFTDLKPKPAYTALACLAEQIGHKPFVKRLETGKAWEYALLFGTPGDGYVTALWSVSGPARYRFTSTGHERVSDLKTTASRAIERGIQTLDIGELPLLVGSPKPLLSARFLPMPVKQDGDTTARAQAESKALTISPVPGLNLKSDLPTWATGTPSAIIQQSSTSTKEIGRFWLGYTPKALCLAADITDTTHLQHLEARTMWQQDSIQLAFDPDRNAGWGRGAYEFGLAGVQRGNRLSPYFHVYESPFARHFDAMPERSVRRSDGHTYYQLALPWSALGVKRPVAGSKYGLALLVNSCDNEGERACSGWFEGISKDKDPDQFGCIVLGR